MRFIQWNSTSDVDGGPRTFRGIGKGYIRVVCRQSTFSEIALSHLWNMRRSNDVSVTYIRLTLNSWKQKLHRNLAKVTLVRECVARTSLTGD